MRGVCLDIGHGGSDPGAVSGTLYEDDLNLTLGELTRSMLVPHNIPVLMTRQKDIDVSLAARVQLANSVGVDLFVSIHHNSYSKPTARGVETFYRQWSSASKLAAEFILQRYQLLIPELPSRGAKIRKGKLGLDYYYVHRKAKMPSIIVEGAFVSSPLDAELIRSKDFLQREATAISQGILLWYGLPIEDCRSTRVEVKRWKE